MIIERLTFQAKYGAGDALVQVLKEAMTLGINAEVNGRILTDVTGPMFRVILEVEHADIRGFADFESRAPAEEYGTAEFQEWFAKMLPLVDRGERELLQTVGE
ncbi:MAG: hypothetical protein IT303_12595 [Dehalococcoidia bacterium]|nr:hypothetical protein [Dehalococcoidia bacterium]